MSYFIMHIIWSSLVLLLAHFGWCQDWIPTGASDAEIAARNATMQNLFVFIGFLLLFVIASNYCFLKLGAHFQLPLWILGLLIGGLYQRLGFVGEAFDQADGLTLGMAVFIFSPTIGFSSNLLSNNDLFYRSKWQALVISVAGVFIKTTLVGVSLRFLTPLGGNISIVEAFIFGSIMSCTEPGPFIARLLTLGVPKRIVGLIAGEAGVTPGFSFFLLLMFQDIHAQGYSFSLTFGQFWTFVGSAFGLSVCIGIIASMLIVYAKRNLWTIMLSLLTPVALVVLAITQYKIFRMSSFLAMTIVGQIMGYVLKPRLRPEVVKNLLTVWETIKIIADSAVYLIAGAFVGSYYWKDTGHVFFANFFWQTFLVFLLVLIARAVQMFVLWPLVNLVGPKIGWKDVLFLSVVGINGAISILMAVGISMRVLAHASEYYKAIVVGLACFVAATHVIFISIANYLAALFYKKPLANLKAYLLLKERLELLQQSKAQLKQARKDFPPEVNAKFIGENILGLKCGIVKLVQRLYSMAHGFDLGCLDGRSPSKQDSLSPLSSASTTLQLKAPSSEVLDGFKLRDAKSADLRSLKMDSPIVIDGGHSIDKKPTKGHSWGGDLEAHRLDARFLNIQKINGVIDLPQSHEADQFGISTGRVENKGSKQGMSLANGCEQRHAEPDTQASQTIKDHGGLLDPLRSNLCPVITHQTANSPTTHALLQSSPIEPCQNSLPAQQNGMAGPSNPNAPALPKSKVRVLKESIVQGIVKRIANGYQGEIRMQAYGLLKHRLKLAHDNCQCHYQTYTYCCQLIDSCTEYPGCPMALGERHRCLYYSAPNNLIQALSACRLTRGLMSFLNFRVLYFEYESLSVLKSAIDSLVKDAGSVFGIYSSSQKAFIVTELRNASAELEGPVRRLLNVRGEGFMGAYHKIVSGSLYKFSQWNYSSLQKALITEEEFVHASRDLERKEQTLLHYFHSLAERKNTAGQKSKPAPKPASFIISEYIYRFPFLLELSPSMVMPLIRQGKLVTLETHSDSCSLSEWNAEVFLFIKGAFSLQDENNRLITYTHKTHPLIFSIAPQASLNKALTLAPKEACQLLAIDPESAWRLIDSSNAALEEFLSHLLELLVHFEIDLEKGAWLEMIHTIHRTFQGPTSLYNPFDIVGCERTAPHDSGLLAQRSYALNLRIKPHARKAMVNAHTFASNGFIEQVIPLSFLREAVAVRFSVDTRDVEDQ